MSRKSCFMVFEFAKKAPMINHMLFADDIYHYCRANRDDASKVTELLSSYKKASWQRINRGKSSVFFSANVITYNKEIVCQELQISEADSSSKYLGLPNILGRNKSVIFGYLRDKVKNSIQSWNEKKIYKLVKEILIKIVFQALPSYAMSVFLLPVKIIRNHRKGYGKVFLDIESKEQI